MKKYFFVLILTVCVLPFANAQIKPIKIGYTNVDFILSLMPESKKVEDDLRKYTTELDYRMQAALDSLQQMQADYDAKKSMMSGPAKLQKEKEIQQMKDQIIQFQGDAQNMFLQKQQTLLQPVLDKLQAAIDAVAKENGYTYIFNSDAGEGTTPILLYGPDEDNVTDLVKKKLGITQ